jgi:uncharacterized protein with NRDE domain
MCLLNFSFHHHSDYKLILVGNRDEFYNRPTQNLHWWDSTILAGKDLKDGGTWMGISRDGNFASLTNYRDLHHIKSEAPSRGIIVSRFLNKELPLEEMHRFLRTQGKLYNGFNLIYGNTDELFYFSNVNERLQQLYPGIYGLSNAFLDTPWTKLKESKTNFESLTSGSKINEELLISSLKNETPAPDDELPLTGADYPLEKILSSMFIKSQNYGTRLTTFVCIDQHDNVIYREKSYVPENDIRFEFKIKKRI